MSGNYVHKWGWTGDVFKYVCGRCGGTKTFNPNTERWIYKGTLTGCGTPVTSETMRRDRERALKRRKMIENYPEVMARRRLTYKAVKERLARLQNGA